MILKRCIEILRDTFNLFSQKNHVISKEIQVTLTIAIICISFLPNSFAESFGLETRHFYVEGIADTNESFANQHIRIFGNEGKVTIIRDTVNSMILVKMTVTASAFCYDKVPTICLNGVVYDVKNTDRPDIGDIVRLNIDPSGKKQTISFLTGQRAGSGVLIYADDGTHSSKESAIQKLISISADRDPLTLANIYEDDGMTKAIKNAQKFTTTHPTFAFDGVKQSLDVNLLSVIQSKIPVYVVQVSFDSEHPGYGDRSDQVLAQVITPHTMIVMISDYGVGSATIDGVWDEFNQNWQK